MTSSPSSAHHFAFPVKIASLRSLLSRNEPATIFLTCAMLWATLILLGGVPGGVRERAVTCPSKGIGGDPALNRQKNRMTTPDRFDPITFPQVIHLPHEGFAGKLSRGNWPAEWQRAVEAQEARGVVIDGFLMEARTMGPESANCGARSSTDVHLALGEAPDAPRPRWLVTELTPRVREGHPMWHMKVLKRLSRDHARVRVSGWLLYDHEHFDRIVINRISAWEIHPVTRIEVWQGGKWAEL